MSLICPRPLDVGNLKEADKQALDRLIDVFAGYMRDKIHEKRRKGFTGWNHDKMINLMTESIEAHVKKAKLDPFQWIDVANLAMFLWNIGVDAKRAAHTPPLTDAQHLTEIYFEGETYGGK